MPDSTAQNSAFTFSFEDKVTSIMNGKDWVHPVFGRLEQWPYELYNSVATTLVSELPAYLCWGPGQHIFFNKVFASSFFPDNNIEEKIGKPASEVLDPLWPGSSVKLAAAAEQVKLITTQEEELKIHFKNKSAAIDFKVLVQKYLGKEKSTAGLYIKYIPTSIITANEFLRNELLLQENEAKLEIVLEASDLGTWEWTLGSDQIICSDRFLEIFGLPPGHCPDREELSQKLHPEDLPIRDAAILKSESTGVFHFQARIILPNDYIRWVELKGRLYSTPETGVSRGLGTCRDITEEKKYQQSLEISEKRFRDMADTTPAFIWMNNADKECTFVNKAWVDFSGLSFKDHLGVGWKSLIHPDDRSGSLQEAEAALNERKEFYIEYRVRRHDGVYRWLCNSGKPKYTANGVFDGYTGACMDINDKVEFEEKLLQSESDYRFLADSLPHFIWVYDTLGVPFYFNKAFYENTGLELNDIKQYGWASLIHPDDRINNMEKWNNSLATGEPCTLEQRFKLKDGQYRWQLTRSMPQRNEEGKIIRWVASSMNIDKLKKHEEEKNNFIKMANHELKTPVTTIKGYVQMMKRTYGNSEDANLNTSLITIEKQVTKLTKLIGNLLDVSKIDTGKLPLIKEPFILSQLVEDTLGDIQAALPSHKLILTSKDNSLVVADKDRISQVLVNLFTNAIKYSPLAKEVLIKVEEKDDEVIVSVQDFGIGISDADQPLIFERFYRVAGKDEKTYPGFGIGLYIVNEIIHLHEGKLWLQSERHTGSTFYFSLPKKEYISIDENQN